MSEARTVGVLGCFARAFAIGIGAVAGLTCGVGCVGGLLFMFQAVSEREFAFDANFDRELMASAGWGDRQDDPQPVCPNAVTPIPWQVQVAPRIQIPVSPQHESFPEQPPHPASEAEAAAQESPSGNWDGPWVEVPAEPDDAPETSGGPRVASKPTDH